MEAVINSEVTRPTFLVRGKEFKFVRFEEPDNIVAWTKTYTGGENHEYFGILKAGSIGTDTLRNIGVWDKLAKELQESLTLAESEVPVNLKLAWKARKEKGPKYPGLAYEIKCVVCGKVIKTSPGMTVKNAEAIAAEKKIIFTPEDYVKSFKCRSCKKEARREKECAN